jgi:LmbE family N-acetylglucosaminyl deacetylase
MMLRLSLPASGLRILAIGAHPDDIEIGCGGTLLRLAGEGAVAAATWLVLSGDGARRDEARAGAAAILAGVPDVDVRVERFTDGYLPAEYAAVKDVIRGVAGADYHLVLVPRRDDAHQDHRLIGELAATELRDHLVLEYEIPKYDGDLGPVNFYATLPEAIASRKVEILLGTFATQLDRDWFTADLFRGLMRLRGVEARAPEGFAEGFAVRKAVV